MRQQPATREQNMKRAIDITRIAHDTLDDEHELLKKGVLEIFRFQHLVSDDTKDPKRVFQFEETNQYLIEPHILTLFTASATIEPVVNHYKQQMFKTEMLANGIQPEMESTPHEGEKGEPIKQEKKSITERLFNRPKKRVVSSDDPYRISIPFYAESMSKLERLERFVEYQAYGVELADFAGFVGMQNYLKFHRTRFKFDVAYPLIRNHKAYIEIIKSKEKDGATMIASSLSHEIFQTRNDMFNQPQPT